MLKKRVIATLVVKDGIVVQSINFEKYLPVGKPHIAIDFLNQWGIDEIILADISATKNKTLPEFKLVRHVAAKCYVPLTVGGGISDISHAKELLHSGADKVLLNHAAIYKPDLISKVAHIFGNQCVVVSIDAKLENGKYRVFDYVLKKTLETTPEQLAEQAEERGAGEIYINSVDRDGSYTGYDIELISSVCNAVKIPVICSGGAKNANDFVEVFSKTNVSAASAANFFHFAEHNVNITKANVIKKHTIRLETHADYKDNDFDTEFRLVKKPDKTLEEMLYIKIEKETI